MSDDWNFHDAIEDGIRDNAGHLALAGALMAHSQRKQQLQSLEASRQHQAQIAKTEAERLQVEKQRLELEKLKQQAEKEEKEAVRLLRVMMAEVGAEFEGLMNRGQLKGSPQGPRRDYAMAVLMSKLQLVRSRSGSLSDLNDLKELSRLENLAQDGVSKHFPGADPLEVTRAKWRELQVWMDGVERLEKQVKQACAVVPDPTALQLPSQADLVAMQTNLEAFAAQLASELSAHAHCLPAEAAPDGVLLGELVEQTQLEDLSAGKQTNRSTAFASRWRQVTTIRAPKDLGMLTSHEVQVGLVQKVQSALAKLKEWQNQHAEHEKTLLKLSMQIEQGDLSGAENTAKKLSVNRFCGLNYGLLMQLLELRGSCKALSVASRDQALRISEDLKKQYPKANDSSELGLLIIGQEQRVTREWCDSLKKKRASLLCGLLTFGLSNIFYSIIDKFSKEKMNLRWGLEKSLYVWKIGSQVDVVIKSKIQLRFCFISSGVFLMGSSDEEGGSKNENQVEVTISQPFWLAKTEVTQAQWEAVMGSNPSHFKGPNLPVEKVSWEDALSYIARLNKKGILPLGWKFALPTEAQWEYACRAGERGGYSGGSLDEVGWYDGNSGSNTHEVGLKNDNAWGLHDMHGNVWEWCADWYDDTLKGGTDPKGPSTGVRRVLRGGSWDRDASYCRAALRYWYTPGNRFNYLGFRPAIVPSN